MNEVIRYKNELNSVSFSGFTAVNQDVFMALCARMKDKNTETISFDFTTLRKLLNYSKKHTNAELVEDLKQMNKKMLNLTCNLNLENKIISFVLFPTFTIDKEKQTLTVRVNPDFAWLLNDFSQGGYTQMELKRFIGIESKYAKTMYRYLRQYRSTGSWKVSYQEFRNLMCVPKTYKPFNINQKIIKPCIEELKPHFKNLKYEPFYLSKPGAPLGGYLFSFDTENEIEGQTTINDYLKKPTKKPKKNKFHNFDQRTYDYDELEKKLLEKN